MATTRVLRSQTKPTTPAPTSKRKATMDDDQQQPTTSSPKRAKSNTSVKRQPKPQKQSLAPKPNQDSTPIPKASQPTTKPIDTQLPPKTLQVTEEKGDIFSALPQALLVHACNAQGQWGSGIALAFKQHYPEAFATYAAHCESYTPEDLVGTALLIPPSNEPRHFVACLFTSRHYGRRKDTKAQILEATGKAVRDLLWHVERYNAQTSGEERKVGELKMCKINSGSFGVPWAKTRAVLEGIELDPDGESGGVTEVKVVDR